MIRRLHHQFDVQDAPLAALVGKELGYSISWAEPDGFMARVSTAPAALRSLRTIIGRGRTQAEAFADLDRKIEQTLKAAG
jgi:hypothetical protein